MLHIATYVTYVTYMLHTTGIGIILLHETTRILLQINWLHVELQVVLHVRDVTVCYTFVTYVTCVTYLVLLHIVTYATGTIPVQHIVTYEPPRFCYSFLLT